jgi:hypothetical protein
MYGEHEKSLSANRNSAVLSLTNPQISRKSAQLYPQTVPKVVLVNVFMFKFELEHNICFMCKEKSTNVFAYFHKILSPQITKRQIRKSKELFQSANLQICELWN